MEAIKYLAEIIACLVLWIGVPAMLTHMGGIVIRRINSEPASQVP